MEVNFLLRFSRSLLLPPGLAEAFPTCPECSLCLGLQLVAVMLPAALLCVPAFCLPVWVLVKVKVRVKVKVKAKVRVKVKVKVRVKVKVKAKMVVKVLSSLVSVDCECQTVCTIVLSISLLSLKSVHFALLHHLGIAYLWVPYLHFVKSCQCFVSVFSCRYCPVCF